MKTLRYVALFFGLLYSVIILHALSFESQTKAKEIQSLASRMKYTELSLSFKESAYKGFVYVP